MTIADLDVLIKMIEDRDDIIIKLKQRIKELEDKHEQTKPKRSCRSS